MKERNAAKISLSALFLIFAILVIIVMGVYIYKLNNDKKLEIQKSAELQAQVTTLNGTVSDLQGKIDSISNTINSSKSNENITSETTKYEELASSLNGGDVLYVTKAEKNSNNTFTLYGVVFKCNKNVNPEVQITDTWTITNDYKKVTVSSDTKCISGYPEEEETTVGKYFNNYGEVKLDENVVNTLLYDKATYSFEFENGKCVTVIDYCTSI